MRSKEYPGCGERVFRTRLPSGLTVSVVPKVGYLKKFAVLAVKYGGADRRFRTDKTWKDTPAGIAHYLEHKMFDLPEGNALEMLTDLGADANAFTGAFRTAYYFSATERFEECLRLLLRFVTTPYFTEESVQKERGIIGQEIGMITDRPSFYTYYGLMRLLYRDHPMRDPVAGSVESIAQITPELLYDCHSAFYRPANMVLTVVGDVDPELVLKLAEEFFPHFTGKTPERSYGKDRELSPVKTRLETPMEVSRPRFLMGAKLMPPENEGGALRQYLTGTLALELLAGSSSPLYASLYHDGLIDRGFGSACSSEDSAAWVMMGGESRDPDAVCLRIMDGAEEFSAGDADAKRLERQKRAMRGSFLRTLDDPMELGIQLTDGVFQSCDWMETPELLQDIRPEEIRKFLRDCLTVDRTAVSVVRPKE